jgi:acyl-CoA reductase-like NAD-dependent aldehyde dehydrogenase
VADVTTDMDVWREEIFGPASPWGRTKASGIGCENGIDGYLASTRTRSVIVNLSEEPFDWYADDGQVRYS